MKTSALFSQILCLLIFNLIITSCNNKSTFNVEPTQKGKGITTNQPPAFAHIETAFDTVAVCDNLELTCILEDPENDPCTYKWDSFKVTEESTEENYHFDYFMNKGEFIQTGKAALWEPGKLNGKYLLLCIASDKAGNEISAKKIVNVKFTGCLSIGTDSLVYKIVGKYKVVNISYMFRNYQSTRVVLRGFIDRLDPIYEKKENDNWIVYYERYYYGYEDIEHIPQIPIVSYTSQLEKPMTDILSLDAGTYRFFVPYTFGSFYGSFTDTLYSNEFKVVE